MADKVSEEKRQTVVTEKWLQADPTVITKTNLLLARDGIDSKFEATPDMLAFDRSPENDHRHAQILIALNLATSQLIAEKATKSKPPVLAVGVYPYIHHENKEVPGIALVKYKPAPESAYKEERDAILKVANNILTTFDQQELPPINIKS